MEIYLVGGAVRDELLGLPVRERDWVVVGATPDDMIAQGYRQVGQDFPVFLHPQSGEEYALARTERKTGAGYTGFAVHAGPEVTLEDDLRRRDLTVNALARDDAGKLIDPYGGRADLEARRLRHVSDAFAEDPVRVLRAARFAARFAPLGFAIDPDTQALMAHMVDDGEVDALVPERVWKETERALASPKPSVYFEALRACGALARVFPEIDALFGVPQPPRWHPEIDTGVHTMMVVDQAARLSESVAVRFAALVHDLGKALTPEHVLPSHRGHEARSVTLIDALCARLRVPNECRDLARSVAANHGKVHRADQLKPATVLRLLEDLDALRRPQRFDEALVACEADARGRLGLEDEPYPQAAYLRGACAAAASVRSTDLDLEGLSGAQIGRALRDARLVQIRRYVAARRAGTDP